MVNADAVCIRRRGLMFSDLEQIKKYERGRRRRLRLEQVRQQSKNIASKILEQTKYIARKELQNLENNKDSKLKRMHEQKIMEIQRRYQEDMEDIGMAHEAAQSQPDSNLILKSKKIKNQITANKRGKEASKRVKEAAQIEDEHEKHQERLRQVREIEDVRSSMISKLSKKISPQKQNDPEPLKSFTPVQSSHKSTKSSSTSQAPLQSSKKPNDKKTCDKLSSNKSSLEPKIKISTAISKKSASPERIESEVHREATSEPNPSEIECVQVPRSSQCHCKNDLNLENPSTIQISSNKPDKLSQYNPSDYQNDSISSSNLSSLSSLVSNNSSYFSDRPTPKTAVISDNLSSSKHQPAQANNEIKVYDYSTRQQNSYNQPEGIVERENIQNLPNAKEMARRISQMENEQVNPIDNQRLIAKKRGDDAILREKVRRDYDNLMKNLDHLSREEQKLKATQITDQQNTNNYLNRSRRRELNEIRRRKIERAFENAQNKIETDSKAVITLHANSKSPRGYETAWQSSSTDDNDDKDDELSREEQILDMLKKIERQKRLLLQEFGSTLPNNILDVTTTPLFNEAKCEEICRRNFEAKQMTASPEIKVINMSNSKKQKKQRVKKTPKATTKISQPSKITPTSSATSEIAVQTQVESKNISEDKSIQVEISPELPQHPTKSKNDTKSESARSEHIEPVVTIITLSSSDTSTVAASNHGIVINVARGKVEVSPRKSQKRVKTRSLPSFECGSSIKRSIVPSTSISAPASRAVTPDQNYRDTTVSSSTSHVESVSERSSSYNVNTMSMEYSKVTQVSVGTNSSHVSPNEVGKSKKPHVLPKKKINYKDTSDASTSYASLPQIIRQNPNEKSVSSLSSILELVDSSSNEIISRERANISPVTTPKTPSPRTMNIPSNLPNAEKVSRILMSNEQPTVIEVNTTREDSQNMNEQRAVRKNLIYNAADMLSCGCGNSKCKKYFGQSSKNEKFDAYTDQNQLDELKYDEELQNSCTEKIASLTAMINQIRDEKNGKDFSTITLSDDSSLMQIPESKLVSNNGVAGLQKVVANIEQVHNRLKGMLIESQNTSMTRRVETKKISLSPNTHTTLANKDKQRQKPRIISNERVHFDIQKIRKVTAGSKTVARKFYQSDDGNIVKKLSQEILEQSEDAEKNMQRDLAMEKAPKNSGKVQDNKGTTTPEFSPVLEDNPRIQNKTSNSMFKNEHTRIDVGFGQLGLSTIDELDTSGTVNRSQTSVNRNPTKQSYLQVPRKSNSKRQQQQQQQQQQQHQQQRQLPTVKNSSTSSRKSPRNEKEKTDKHTSPISILKDSSQNENQHGDSGENLPIEKSVKSPDSFLTHYSNRNIGAGDFFNQINIRNAIAEYEAQIKHEKITSSSSNSVLGLSGVSEIIKSTSLESIAASPPEPMDFQLQKLGLSWLIPVVTKTREASALSSSSNSDTTLTINKRTKSSVKKYDGISYTYFNFSDVSSIEIREASKSTEKNVLMRARTSTPNIPTYYYTSDKSNLTTSTTSGKSL